MAEETSLVDEAKSLELWGKMPYWQMHEAAALLSGKDPLQSKELSDLEAKHSVGLWELIQRAIEVKRLSDPIEPILFLEWAAQNDLSIPKALAKSVAKYHDACIDWKKEAARERERAEKADEGFDHYLQLVVKRDAQIANLEAELAKWQSHANALLESPKAVALQRSIGSLLKLVGGMAIAAYGFNPYERRSNVVKQIQNDLDLKGVAMDEDTIRKWLKEGAKVAIATGSSADKPNSVTTRPVRPR
jgi:hypothetical protein